MNLILRKTVPAVIFIINTAFVISNFGLSMYTVIILCLCFLLCSAANSTVHEAGHFVFGKITGYILLYINIGFLTLYKDNNDKLRLKLTPETKYRCIMYPSKDKKTGYFLYNAGGIAANILLTAVGVKYCLSSAGYFRLLFLELVITGIYAVFSNSIPSINNGIPNDSYTLRLLSTNKSARDDYVNYLRLYANYYCIKKFDVSEYFYDRKILGKNDNLIYYEEIKKILNTGF